MTGEHPPTTVPSRLRDEPLSVKFTYATLADSEPSTQQQLARQMQTSKRTVRHALGKLEGLGEVQVARDSGGDARKKWYELMNTTSEQSNE